MRSLLVVSLAMVALLPSAAVAQVGFPPRESPYRPIENGTYVEGAVGRILGGGGRIRVGPRDGTSEALRLIIRGRNTLQFSFGAWTANTRRSVIDADDSVATRDKGLVDQRLIGFEIGIHLNLTGGKTWHRLAPYAGVDFGLVHGSKSPAADTSGYQFGTKLFFAPAVGTRLFLSSGVYLRFDARPLFWKLVYPVAYSDEPAAQPGTGTQSNAVNPAGSLTEYTLTPQFQIGLGIAW